MKKHWDQGEKQPVYIGRTDVSSNSFVAEHNRSLEPAAVILLFT